MADSITIYHINDIVCDFDRVLTCGLPGDVLLLIAGYMIIPYLRIFRIACHWLYARTYADISQYEQISCCDKQYARYFAITTSREIAADTTHEIKYEFRYTFAIMARFTLELIEHNIHMPDHYICGLNSEAAYALIVEGDLCRIMSAYNHGIDFSQCDAADTAVAYEHFDVLKWVYQNLPNMSLYACESAAAVGRLDILNWLVDNCDDKYPINIASSYLNAAEHGHIAVLDWLNLRYLGNHILNIYDAASRHERIDVCEWANNNGLRPKRHEYKYAIENNKMIFLQWIYDKGHLSDSCLYYFAIESHNINMVKWLYEHKLQPDELVLCRAARYDLDIMHWLQDIGFNISLYTCSILIESGHFDELQKVCTRELIACDKYSLCASAVEVGRIDILKWLINMGSKTSANLLFHAAKYDRYEIFEYLIAEYKYSATEYHTKLAAARSGSIKILQYMIDIRTHITLDMLFKSIKSGRLDAMKLIYAQICNTNIDRLGAYSNIMCGYVAKIPEDTINNIADANNESALDTIGGIFEWLLSKGYYINNYVWITAVERDNIIALKWLHAHKYEPDNIIELCDSASALLQFRVLKWLLRTYRPDWDYQKELSDMPDTINWIRCKVLRPGYIDKS